MTAILGVWEINANDSHGRLNIFSIDNQGNFMGNVTFNDAARFNIIQGRWNDAAGTIVFQRALAQTGTNQNYTGFLGDNHADQLLILGGFFTQDGVVGSRTQFGWFAQQTQPPTLSPPSASIVPPCADPGSCIVQVLPGDLTGSPPTEDTETFDMTGHTRPGQSRRFSLTAKVTDVNGVSASANQDITISVSRVSNQ